MPRTALILGFLWLCGCRQLVGLSDYESGSGDAGTAGGHTPDPGPPDASVTAPGRDSGIETQPPFLTGSACEACMEASCGEQRAGCDADANCAYWLQDMMDRPDPSAYFERLGASMDAEALSLGNALWSDQHGSTMISSRWWPLRGCARELCADACAVGRDFGCTGAFDYPEHRPQQLRVRLRVVDARNTRVGLPDWRIRACSPQDLMCLPDLGVGVSDGDGFLELDVKLPSLTVTPADFNAYFLMEDGDEFLPVLLQRTGPLIDGSVLIQNRLPTSTVDDFFLAFGVERLPELGLLYVQSFDCLGIGARNVTAEIWIAEGSEYRACDDDCGILYQNDVGVPDPTRTELSGMASLVFVYNVPPREVAIVVRDTESRAVVGVQHLVVRGGHAHELMIYPPSRLQLTAVPREAR